MRVKLNGALGSKKAPRAPIYKMSRKSLHVSGFLKPYHTKPTGPCHKTKKSDTDAALLYRLLFLELCKKYVNEYAEDKRASDRSDNNLADSNRHTADTGDKNDRYSEKV